MKRVTSLILLVVITIGCRGSRNPNPQPNSNVVAAASSATNPNGGSPQNTPHELFRTQESSRLLYDPRQHDYKMIRDRRKEVAEISKRFKPTAREKKLFLERNADLENQRNSRLANRSLAAADGTKPPVPGGMGGGVFFRDSELIFSQSSANYNYIIAPPTLGGNTAEYFYLTATNRAGRGCEAFVSYSHQDKPLFKVFDWARYADHQDPWVVSIPYDEWGGNKLTYNMSGQDHYALYTVNATYWLGNNNWRNDVYLHNGDTGTSDLVWSYDFQWTPKNAEEKNAHWWGPLLETFAIDYGDTNTVGFAEALLVQDGFERALVDTNSYISNDGSDHGFQIFDLTPNYTYLAH